MSYEESLHHLIVNVLQPIGYDILSISRVPYISDGDTVQPFYVLDDAIIVMRKKVT
jgi:hypothetical protein